MADNDVSKTTYQVDGERPTLSLSSLFGRKFKKRRKKQHITVDDLDDPDSEDDDYKVLDFHVTDHVLTIFLSGPRGKKEPQRVRGRGKKIQEAGE